MLWRKSALYVLGRLIILLLLILSVIISQSSSPAEPFEASADPLPGQLRRSMDWQLMQLYNEANGLWNDAHQARYMDITAGGTVPASVADAAGQPPLQQAIYALDWPTARSAAYAHLNETPDDPYTHLALGVLTYPQDDARQHLQQVAAEANPYQGLAAELLGLIAAGDADWHIVGLRLLADDEVHLADYAFTQAIDAAPLEAFHYAYRGFVRDQQGRDGLADIRYALNLDPGLALGYYMLGLHHRAREAYDESLQAFLDAHLLDEDNPAYAAEVAQAYVLNDTATVAEEWFHTAVRLSDRDAAFVALAAAFYVDENLALAEMSSDFVRQAAQDFPDNASIQASWGRLLYFENELESAQAALTRAQGIAPNDPRVRFFQAELLEQQGEIIAALDIYTALVRAEGSYSQPAQRAILRLTS